jgi:hypothetical protein
MHTIKIHPFLLLPAIVCFTFVFFKSRQISTKTYDTTTVLTDVFFQKIKPNFPYVNKNTFCNLHAGRNDQFKAGKRIDSWMYKKLFAGSEIFRSFGAEHAYYYTYNVRQDYYQIVVTGFGRYTPFLVLLTYAKNGKLLKELEVASSFFDAGSGEYTVSQLLSDAVLVRSTMNVSERSVAELCDSTVSKYRITKTGKMQLFFKQTFKSTCSVPFDCR